MSRRTPTTTGTSCTYGQEQVANGVVIDSRTLATIHHIGPDRAVVDAGVQWLDLIKAALEAGRTPPVSTDYLGLSVGGTTERRRGTPAAGAQP